MISRISSFFWERIVTFAVADREIENAIDKSIDIIERQIRKNKTRLEKKFKTGAFEALPDEEAEDEINVTKTKRFTVSHMSVEEAILQMNLLGHSFFLFINEENDSINLVYKKSNGEYGVIEPVIE